MVKPFLDLLFPTAEATVDYQKIVAAGSPSFSIAHIQSWIVDFFNFHMSTLILTDGKLRALLFVCVLIVILTFAKNLFRYLAMYVIAPIRNGVVRDIRNNMIKKSLHLPLSYFSDEKKGDIMSRMTADVVEIEWSIMQSLEMITREPLIIILLVASLLIISVKLTLYIVLLLPIAAIIVIIIGKSLKRSAGKAKGTLGSLVTVMEETLGSLKVIKAFTAENFISKKFNSINQTYYNEQNKVYRKTDLTSPISEFVMVAVLMMVLYIGCSMVITDNELSGAAIITYFVLASQIIPPIKQITSAYTNIQKGLASEERINKILFAENNVVDPEQPITKESFNESIEYKNVSFGYLKGDGGYALKNINIKISKGKTIALVGQSGSGKTTMADLLPRFYDTTSGEVLIDGVSVKAMKIEELRKLFGIVTQEPILFNDTIYNNIAFGLDNVPMEKVIEAAKIANAHEFIDQLPNGYQTLIGDRGGKLSGGQKQRVSIARAVLKNPPILILDEATSALDTESERMVQDALNKLMKSRTSVIIAHRLSTIVHADEIVVLNKGEIVERGSHEELIKHQGAYKKLYEMQAF